MRLYLIRHGQTPWNILKRYQGITDIPLSEHGVLQSRLLAEGFANTPLDVIYCSPLIRARQTAAELAKVKNMEPVVEPTFREIDYGHWEGKTIPELNELYGDAHWLCLTNPGDERYPFPGEGSLQNVLKRIWPATERILNEHKDQNVAIVAHGGILKVMALKLLDLPISHYNKFWMDNTGVSIIEIRNNEFVLTRLNDKSHLRGKIPK
ncbi:MAG: histidine phosphatase family protein [Firmicutes bacterium]|nr:histidine phosphatase family protein [Bacillota bacterium]